MSITSPRGTAWVYLDIARAVEQTGSIETLRTMLAMLQEMLKRDLPQIEQLLAKDDARSANSMLHSLKGCLPIFCAPALCEQLAQVERVSKRGGSARAAYAELSPKLVELQDEVARYLAQPPSQYALAGEIEGALRD